MVHWHLGDGLYFFRCLWVSWTQSCIFLIKCIFVKIYWIGIDIKSQVLQLNDAIKILIVWMVLRMLLLWDFSWIQPKQWVMYMQGTGKYFTYVVSLNHLFLFKKAFHYRPLPSLSCQVPVKCAFHRMLLKHPVPPSSIAVILCLLFHQPHSLIYF